MLHLPTTRPGSGRHPIRERRRIRRQRGNSIVNYQACKTIVGT